MENDFILVTGASGFIGSHCVVALSKAGYKVIAMENSKSNRNFVFPQISKILGWEVETCSCNLLNYDKVAAVFERHKITAVIHLAATKGVSESMNLPIEFYRNNLVGTMNLLEAMKIHGVKRLIFSSSCAIYGNQTEIPVKESAVPQNLTSVYGKSKYFIEEILSDLAASDSDMKIAILRYFNPVGSHPSGLIGEDPQRKQVSFLTLLAKTAMDSHKTLSLFGSSNVRDFIHIMDVAEAHVKVLEKINSFEGFKIFNIGTGNGFCLLQLIHIFEQVNQVKIGYTTNARRAGEIEAIVADMTLAEKELDWKPKRNIEEMCRDCWKWMKYHADNLQ